MTPLFGYGEPLERFRDWATCEDCLVLDTETTGLGNYAEILELALVDMHGEVRFHSRFKPIGGITPDASAIHGIYAADVEDAPCFADLYPQLFALTEGKRLLAYNSPFERRMLDQTIRIHGLEPLEEASLECVMEAYTALHPPRRRGRFKISLSLDKALLNEGILKEELVRHGAVSDALLTWKLVQKLGKREFPSPQAGEG